jgi:hypothetical protein
MPAHSLGAGFEPANAIFAVWAEPSPMNHFVTDFAKPVETCKSVARTMSF